MIPSAKGIGDALRAAFGEADGTDATAGLRALSSPRAAGWTVLCPDLPGGRALVITATLTPAPYVLLDVYDSVDVWSIDPDVREVLRAAFGSTAERVRIVDDPGLNVDRVRGRYAAIVLVEAFGALDRARPDALGDLLGKLLAPTGGVLVVSGNRFGRSEMRRSLSRSGSPAAANDLPSLPRVRGGLRRLGLTIRDVHYFYQDRREPKFLLRPGERPDEPYPPGRFKRLLQRTGYLDPVGNGFAVAAVRGDARRSVLDAVLDDVARALGCDTPPIVRGVRILETGTVLVRILAPRLAGYYVRVPLMQSARDLLARSRRQCIELELARPALAPLLPRSLHAGRIRHLGFELEPELPGVIASSVVVDERAAVRVRENVLEFALALAGPEPPAHPVDEVFAERFLTPPFAQIAGDPRAPATAVTEIGRLVVQKLSRHRMPLVRRHGDLNSKNILVGPDLTLTGVIDWDQATDSGLPVLDLLHFYLSLHRRRTRVGLGEVVCRMLEGTLLGDDEGDALDRYARAVDFDPALIPPLAAVYWAMHLANQQNLTTTFAKPKWRRAVLEKPSERIIEALR